MLTLKIHINEFKFYLIKVAQFENIWNVTNGTKNIKKIHFDRAHINIRPYVPSQNNPIAINQKILNNLIKFLKRSFTNSS